MAEEIAWLAARFPGRVGLGVASGALRADFEIMHVPMDGLAKRFHEGFEELAGMLNGTDARGTRRRPRDPGVRRAPDPGGERGDGLHRGAARRALRRGMLFDSLSIGRALPRAHRRVPRAGGTGSAS